MSDKIFRYKVEAVDKPLKSMQEQLKSIFLTPATFIDIFKKQREEMMKLVENIGTPILSATLANISNEGLMRSHKEIENDVLQLCVDKDKAAICLEELISVIKGKQEETENSYLGLLLIADTVGKLNLFLTSVLTNKDASVIGEDK